MCKRLAISLLSVLSVAATAQISNQPRNLPPRPVPKPFTMTQVRTVTQTFGDGLTRTTTQESTMMRDSSGRTRNESAFPGPPPAIYDRDGRKSFQQGFNASARTVNINDPMTQSNVNWIVSDTQPHEARVVSYAPTTSSAQRRTPNARPPASDNLPVIEERTEKLGTRAIQGVIAIGTRTTTKYPAGYDGWSREFTTIRESWLASDYGFVVESTTDEPRTGKTVLTLVSFTDGEPDPALFKPPADYKILTQVTQVTTEPSNEKP